MAWLAVDKDGSDVAFDSIVPSKPEVEKKPVAFISQFKNGNKHYSEVAFDDDSIPLFTHPQPKREPLSESEIFNVLDKNQNSSDWIKFARAIEKAHGIGVE